jgi:hypothetical protein
MGKVIYNKNQFQQRNLSEFLDNEAIQSRSRSTSTEKMENAPPDYFVKKQQFVKRVYGDVYPDIDPTAASNSQEGKVVV